MSEQEMTSTNYLSFLRGGESNEDIYSLITGNEELFSKAIKYSIDGGGYHRQNLVYSVVAMIAQKENLYYRQIGWALFQEIPFSYLLELPKVIKTPRKEISNRLRTAMVRKIVSTPIKEIERAYFFSPNWFSKIFELLKLPKEKITDKYSDKTEVISNPRYKRAVKLSEMSLETFTAETPLIKFYTELGIPIEKLQGLVKDPVEVINLAKVCKADQFFHHARWFKQFLGDDEFTVRAIEKMEHIKNPMRFVSIEQHLLDTGALTEDLTIKIKEITNKIFEELMANHNIKNIALLVDMSGSMYIAQEVTLKLYNAFENMGTTISQLIAFHAQAGDITFDRLKNTRPSGGTSIGAPIVYLHNLIFDNSEISPDLIILISDMDENNPPALRDTVELLKQIDKPLIVMLCGRHARRYSLNYPHAVMEISDFRPSLAMDVIKEVAKLGQKAIQTQEITKMVKTRDIQEESIFGVKLPERPAETMKKNYMKQILTSKSL